MNEKSVKKLIVISSILVILLAAIVYEFKYLTEFQFLKKKDFLIIGILSAPENFQQRLSIRKTWLQLLPEISASAYFIIGNQVCNVPLSDRADPYSCVDKPFRVPKSATPSTEFTTMKIQNLGPKTSHSGFIGFGFHVRSSITVTKLGILKEVLVHLNKEIQVKLISASDNIVLASVTFGSDLLNESDSFVLTKAIRPVRLSADFEGILKLEMKDMTSAFFPECLALWENEPDIVNFIQLWQEGSVIPQPFDENSCSYVFLSYTIADIEYMKQHTNNRTSRLNKLLKINKKLLIDLHNESRIYKDIFLVDVIDTYRNLSIKLTHFYKRIVHTNHFQYLLKADDDSFIDIQRVYKHLKHISSGISLMRQNYWLWSFFKEYWKVQHSGKWRENQYQSASYPTFPCGGGYVLNKGIVDFIAENNHLHHFQGEDVSLGIWLSTLPVTYYKTPKLVTESTSRQSTDLCEWTCNNIKHSNLPLCNKVQLSAANMYAEWKDYTERGFL